MDFWSMTGAGTQALIEFTALIIEIVAIVVIIEWLRKRREDRLLEGVRRHLGDEIIHDIRKLIRSLAVLAVSEDSRTWEDHQARALDVAAQILRQLDDAIAKHYMDVQLISLFGRAQKCVETTIDSLKAPIEIATWIDEKPVSRRGRDIGLGSYELLVTIHDELMETIHPGDHVKKLARLGVDRVALIKAE